jgi:hypothetical protein
LERAIGDLIKAFNKPYISDLYSALESNIMKGGLVNEINSDQQNDVNKIFFHGENICLAGAKNY